MKVKALLAIAAALALSACVVADDPYYDDYSRENSARDYDHYDHVTVTETIGTIAITVMTDVPAETAGLIRNSIVKTAFPSKSAA